MNKILSKNIYTIFLYLIIILAFVYIHKMRKDLNSINMNIDSLLSDFEDLDKNEIDLTTSSVQEFDNNCLMVKITKVTPNSKRK